MDPTYLSNVVKVDYFTPQMLWQQSIKAASVDFNGARLFWNAFFSCSIKTRAATIYAHTFVLIAFRKRNNSCNTFIL